MFNLAYAYHGYKLFQDLICTKEVNLPLVKPRPQSPHLRIISVCCNNAPPSTRIRALRRNVRVRAYDQIRHALDIRPIEIDITLRFKHSDGILLTVATAAPSIVEERPNASTVEEEVGGAANALKERHATRSIRCSAVREGRVGHDEVASPRDRSEIVPRALPIRCFALLQSAEYI